MKPIKGAGVLFQHRVPKPSSKHCLEYAPSLPHAVLRPQHCYLCKHQAGQLRKCESIGRLEQHQFMTASGHKRTLIGSVWNVR